MTRRTANTELLGQETLDISPADAARLGIGDGDLVELTSRRDTITVPARITEQVAPGELFIAFHFADVLSNRLTSLHADAVTGCPEYKVIAVAVNRPR